MNAVLLIHCLARLDGWLSDIPRPVPHSIYINYCPHTATTKRLDILHTTLYVVQYRIVLVSFVNREQSSAGAFQPSW